MDMQKKTFKTLEVGDFVKYKHGFRKVLAVIHRGSETEESVYVISSYGEKDSYEMKRSSGTYTSFNLDACHFIIDQPEEEVEELTMEQVYKELGRVIKIKK